MTASQQLFDTTITEVEAENASLRQAISDAEAAQRTLIEDRALADRECRRLRRESQQLRIMLKQAHESDPRSKVIREILEHWRHECHHEHSMVPIDGERANRVRRALEWNFTATQVKLAITAAGRFPYVVDFKRSSHGTKAQRYDQLETILKSEKSIETLLELVDEPATKPAPPRQPLVMARGEQPIDAFLRRLEGVKTTGLSRWTALCPAHEDRVASMSVAIGAEGKVLVRCFVGCGLEEITRAMGLEVADLFDDDPAPVAIPKSPPVPVRRAKAEPLAMEDHVATWRERLAAHGRLLERLSELRGWTAPTLYRLDVGFDGQRLTLPIRDPEGQLVNILRYLPVRKEGDTKLYARAGCPRDLFPSPDALKAKGNEVWLFEGEPDAITGHELGLHCAGIPGTNGWRPEWGERFSGHRVIVCLDCDNPGRQTTERIVPTILPHAKEVRIFDLAPERNDGYDISDYVKAGGTVGNLLAMVRDRGGLVTRMDAA